MRIPEDFVPETDVSIFRGPKGTIRIEITTPDNDAVFAAIASALAGGGLRLTFGGVEGGFGVEAFRGAPQTCQ